MKIPWRLRTAEAGAMTARGIREEAREGTTLCL